MLHFINNSTNNFNVYKSCCLKLDSNPFTCILINTLSKKEFTFSLTQIAYKIRIEFEIELDNIDAGDYTFKLIQNDQIVYMEKLTVVRLENNVILDKIESTNEEIWIKNKITFTNEINVVKYLFYANDYLIEEFNYNTLNLGIYNIEDTHFVNENILLTYKIEIIFNDNSIKTILNGVMIPTAPNPPLLQFDNVI